MPKITDYGEVLSGGEAVLGDTMTVTAPRRLRSQVRAAPKRSAPKRSVPQLADYIEMPGETSLGCSVVEQDGCMTQLGPRASQAIQPTTQSAFPVQSTPLALQVVSGAVKGTVYGALLGKGTMERRLGGGAAGGAVAFPLLSKLVEAAENHLAECHGVVHPVADAALKGAAHVGGAVVSTVAAGGEAVDGAIAGTAAVLGSYILDWFVGK